MENRFLDALDREQPESGEEERMNETLSEAGEDMELEATPNEQVVTNNFSHGTTRQLLQGLSANYWADTVTPPLGSPRKNLELPLASEPSNMGMVRLSDEARGTNTFGGNKWLFFDTLDQKG